MSTSREIDFDLKLAEYRINGYAVFEEMLPLETVDRLYAAFLPLLEHVRQRDTEVSRVERGDVRTGLGRLQTTNRYTLTVPWVAPFAAPELFAHPVMLEFIERYWGDASSSSPATTPIRPIPAASTSHGTATPVWRRRYPTSAWRPVRPCRSSFPGRYLRRKRQLRAAAVDAIPGRSRAGDALRTTCCGAAASRPPSAST